MDTDQNGNPDFQDRDSDNDGIYDGEDENRTKPDGVNTGVDFCDKYFTEAAPYQLFGQKRIYNCKRFNLLPMLQILGIQDSAIHLKCRCDNHGII